MDGGFGGDFVGVERKDVHEDYEGATKFGEKVCWKGMGVFVSVGGVGSFLILRCSG